MGVWYLTAAACTEKFKVNSIAKDFQVFKM